MSYQILYEPGDRDLIIVQYHEAVRLEQFYTALTASLQYPRESGRAFDIVFELTYTEPPSLDLLPKLHRAAALPETAPDLGMIILVVNNDFMATLVTAFIQLYPIAGKYYRVVNSMDEARRLIN
ncbi:MAG: hypothetical protein IAE89_02850, partial [Anaerolineae bacterium]|nr:hypothetical protein [Anaerolineae bacterium]